MTRSERRVVITGCGVISPVGLNVSSFWQNVSAGNVGICRLDQEDSRIKVAGQIRDFDPLKYMERREARRMDRYSQFAIAAAKEAVEESSIDLTAVDPWRFGVIIGSGVGGLETIAVEYRKLYLEGGPGRISPFFIPMMIANMAAAQVSMLLGAKGSNLCITSACASGTHALGEAFRAVKHGYLDICLAGGAEAPITPIALAGFDNMKALSHSDDPAASSIPFDLRRDGFVIAEGAGILMLETLESALQRGAPIICELAGYGSTADAFHITSPDPQGLGASMAMKQALAEAGMPTGAVSYINAHGTSTPLNDKYETLAIKHLFSDRAYDIAISSTKAVTGHMLGAAGAIEAIASALAIKYDLIPPTAGLTVPDPACDLDYVPVKARQRRVDVALSNSLGFGGHNGTLCLKKVAINED